MYVLHICLFVVVVVIVVIVDDVDDDDDDDDDNDDDNNVVSLVWYILIGDVFCQLASLKRYTWETVKLNHACVNKVNVAIIIFFI